MFTVTNQESSWWLRFLPFHRPVKWFYSKGFYSNIYTEGLSASLNKTLLSFFDTVGYNCSVSFFKEYTYLFLKNIPIYF